MESTPTPTNTNETSNDTNWAVILLGAIGIYLLFRKPKAKDSKSTEEEDKKINTFDKFKKTPMGKSIDEQLDEEGVELSDNQIKMLDKCLEGLSEKEYKVISKASQFVKKEDLYKALSDEEMKTFLPVRRKIMDCVDATLNS
jgi:translation elongation factor EF-G